MHAQEEQHGYQAHTWMRVKCELVCIKYQQKISSSSLFVCYITHRIDEDHYFEKVHRLVSFEPRSASKKGVENDKGTP